MTAGPVSELLARASLRESVSPDDGKSHSTFERVTIDGESYFLKQLSPASDWVMRVTGDHVHRPYRAWSEGIMDRVPPSIDHAVVAMEVDGVGDAAVLSILMRDVQACLVPEGDEVVPPEQHAGFVDHLAELSATFWGFSGVEGLTSMAERLRCFSAANVTSEKVIAAAAGRDLPGVLAVADAGWKALHDRAPRLAALAFLVHDRPEILTAPLAETPVTFLHGDWKMGNLGTHPDGRTILLDWSFPGSGPACHDLWWYIALNRARLPESKEATIARFEEALRRHGVDTTSWFERQLDLCLVAIMVSFGWEKAVGDDDELRWWEQRVAQAVERQALDVSQSSA